MDDKNTPNYSIQISRDKASLILPDDQGVVRMHSKDLAKITSQGMPRAFFFNTDKRLKHTFCRDGGRGGDSVNVANIIADATSNEHTHLLNGDQLDYYRENIGKFSGARCSIKCSFRLKPPKAVPRAVQVTRP